jgi:hypothetical protein
VCRARRFGAGDDSDRKPSGHQKGKRQKRRGIEKREGHRAQLSARKRDQRPRDVEREIAGEPVREFWLALGLMLVDKPQK